MRALVALLLVQNLFSQICRALGMFRDLNFTLFKAKIKYKTPFDVASSADHILFWTDWRPQPCNVELRIYLILAKLEASDRIWKIRNVRPFGYRI